MKTAEFNDLGEPAVYKIFPATSKWIIVVLIT
jgi:hypothetical protein